MRFLKGISIADHFADFNGLVIVLKLLLHDALVINYSVFDEPLMELVEKFCLPLSLNKNLKLLGVKPLTGSSLDTILHHISTHHVPCVIWITLKLRPSFHMEGEEWTDYMDHSQRIKWLSPEHCVTLVGYNQHEIIVHDPDEGRQVRYDRKVFEERFVEMGSRAFSFLVEQQ